MDLVIDPGAEKTAGVYRALRAAIADGRLPEAHRLPATRAPSPPISEWHATVWRRRTSG